MDFAIPADHKGKLKESGKKEKYLELAKELNEPWFIKVTFIAIVIGAFGRVTKVLIQGVEDLEIRGRIETIQTTALLRSAKILRRVLETWRDLPVKDDQLKLMRKTLKK